MGREKAPIKSTDRSHIWGKRLESGRFISDWSRVRTQEMDWMGLKLLLKGMEGRRGGRYASDTRCQVR
jgi:hypothetical protein